MMHAGCGYAVAASRDTTASSNAAKCLRPSRRGMAGGTIIRSVLLFASAMAYLPADLILVLAGSIPCSSIGWQPREGYPP